MVRSLPTLSAELGEEEAGPGWVQELGWQLLPALSSGEQKVGTDSLLRAGPAAWTHL